MTENIAVSQQIVRDFRKEFGRPHSWTFINIKMLQHKGDPVFSNVLDKLRVLRDIYSQQNAALRSYFEYWYKTLGKEIELPEYIKMSEKFIRKFNIGNCEDMAEIVQFRHLEKGIITHNIGIEIQNKNDILPRDHVISLVEVPENIDFTKPKTWGKSVLVDSHSGSGIVGQAVIQEKSNKKGTLQEVLDYLVFNPDKETVKFYNCDTPIAKKYIEKIFLKKCS